MFYKFKAFCGAKRWYFPDPDNTDHMHEGATRAELVRNIVFYRSQNQLPFIEELHTVLDSYLCSRAENIGACSPLPLRRGLYGFLRGGVALISNVWYNKTVSQEEADRRSEICKDCINNVFPDKGPFIKWSDEMAVASVGDKKSKYHDDLGNCEICTCPLRAKVWFDEKITLTSKEKQAMKESTSGRCWQLKVSA